MNLRESGTRSRRGLASPPDAGWKTRVVVPAERLIQWLKWNCATRKERTKWLR